MGEMGEVFTTGNGHGSTKLCQVSSSMWCYCPFSIASCWQALAEDEPAPSFVSADSVLESSIPSWPLNFRNIRAS
jgi:hypothetical protein